MRTKFAALTLAKRKKSIWTAKKLLITHSNRGKNTKKKFHITERKNNKFNIKDDFL